MQGISLVQAECNSNNEATLDLTPHVMSFQLVEMAPCDYIDLVLSPYRSQLTKFLSNEKIHLLEQHELELFNANKREPGSKFLIDKHDRTTFLNMGWDDLKGRFEHLWIFCGGLANAFANTTNVEVDFSIMKWEENYFWHLMMNMTLEGIFQAKQRRVMMGIHVPIGFDDDVGAQ